MIRSLLDAKEFRPMESEEKKTFDVLRESENNMNVGVDLKSLGVPATLLDSFISEVYGEGLAKSFHVEVMTKRLAVMNPSVTYSPFTLIFFAMSADRVGVAVMWAFTMFDYYRRTKKVLTLDAVDEWFKGQLPTEDSMHNIWDEQKVAADGRMSDNQIDCRAAWQL